MNYMLHNTSSFDIINIIDDTYPNEHHTDTSVDNNDTLPANATYIQDNVSPPDIHKVLFTVMSTNPAT